MKLLCYALYTFYLFGPFLLHAADINLKKHDGCQPPVRGPNGPGLTGPTGPTGGNGLNGPTGPTGEAPFAEIIFSQTGTAIINDGEQIPFNTPVQSFGGIIATPPTITVTATGFYYVHFVTSNDPSFAFDPTNFPSGAVQLALGPTGASAISLPVLTPAFYGDTPVVLQQLLFLNAGDQLSVIVPSSVTGPSGIYYNSTPRGVAAATLTVFQVGPPQ